MNPIKDAITLVGNVTEFARALGVTPQAVCFWRDGNRKIPADKCPLIERVTGGVVTCEALRPDVDWSYIRGTPGVKQPSATTSHGIEALAAAPLTADPLLEADLEKAEQAGLVHLPKKASAWNGVERRVAPVPRRLVDRNRDIADAGQGVA